MYCGVVRQMLLTHRDAAVLSMTLRSLLQDKLESKAVIGCHSHGKGPQVDATVGVGVTFGGNCCSSMLNCVTGPPIGDSKLS